MSLLPPSPRSSAVNTFPPALQASLDASISSLQQLERVFRIITSEYRARLEEMAKVEAEGILNGDIAYSDLQKRALASVNVGGRYPKFRHFEELIWSFVDNAEESSNGISEIPKKDGAVKEGWLLVQIIQSGGEGADFWEIKKDTVPHYCAVLPNGSFQLYSHQFSSEIVHSFSLGTMKCITGKPTNSHFELKQKTNCGEGICCCATNEGEAMEWVQALGGIIPDLLAADFASNSSANLETVEDIEKMSILQLMVVLREHPSQKGRMKIVKQISERSVQDCTELERILPQFCNMLLDAAQPCLKELEGILFDSCVNSIHFAMLAIQILDSVDESTVADESRKRSITEIKGRLISSVITGVMDQRRPGQLADAQTHIHTQSMLLPLVDKTLELSARQHIEFSRQHRWRFIRNTRDLLQELTNLSSNLRSVPKPSRDTVLREQLTLIQKKLPKLCYIPLCFSGDEIKEILGFVVADSFSLSTFEKVPYMLLIEYCKRNAVCARPPMEIEVRKDPKSVEGNLMLHQPLIPTDDEILSPKNGADKSLVTEEEIVASARHRNRMSVVDGVIEMVGSVADEPSSTATVLSNVFGEMWSVKVQRIRKKSRKSREPGWGLMAVIVKSNDDLRQEQFAMQLIQLFQRIWSGSLPNFLSPYNIVSTSKGCGLIEVIPNAVSLATLKRRHKGYTSLLDFYYQAYGPAGSAGFQEAQDKFVGSMAAYSVVTYLLQIKDRHDGNILIKHDGSIAHIDFGFMLGRTMPMNIEEGVPFKLTQEQADLMLAAPGPSSGAPYQKFLALCIQYYMRARQHAFEFINLVQTMQGDTSLPCLDGGKRAQLEFINRFHTDWSDKQCINFFMQLHDTARSTWRTGMYDAFQRFLNVY